MKTTLTTLNKIIPQPQNQSAVNRVVEEGKEFINENFRKAGYATYDFDGEENTKELLKESSINHENVIVSLIDKDSDFYGPSIGELATGMQQIQKVNNSLNRFSAQNVLMNKIYASTTFYGNIINNIYSEKTTNGVWVYNSELGCICPKPLTNTTNLLKFFKFKTDQINSSGTNDDSDFENKQITSVSFILDNNHLTMKEISNGVYEPSDGNSGKCNVTLTINENALVKNVHIYATPSDAVEIISDYNNNNIYNWHINPKQLTNVFINCIINEREGDIEYNLDNQNPPLSQTITITKESQYATKIQNPNFDVLNTSLNVIKEEGTDNYVPENNNYGTVTFNINCNIGTELYQINWYTSDNTVINLSTTEETIELSGLATKENYSFSTEIHPLKPGENVKVWCVINEEYDNIKYDTNVEISNLIPKFTVKDNTPVIVIPDTPEEPEGEEFNMDNILWYFRYTPSHMDIDNNIYSSEFDDIDKTNKLFKLNTDNDNLVVYPHKSYIPSTNNNSSKFDTETFMIEGCYVFDIYIVLKNNYKDLGNIRANNIQVDIIYKGHHINCNINNVHNNFYDDDLQLNTPFIVLDRSVVDENNVDVNYSGHVIWKIRFEENCDLNFHNNISNIMYINIKKGTEIIYTKSYNVYCWDMVVQNTIYNNYFQLVNASGNNMFVGRDRQRLYNVKANGKAMEDNEVFQGYNNETELGKLVIYSGNYKPNLLSVYENQQIKYLDTTGGIQNSKTKGLSPTYQPGQESTGTLMNMSFSPSELYKINGVKYYFVSNSNNSNNDTYSLNFYEHYNSADFWNKLIQNKEVYVRIFKKENNGIWGFNDIPYFKKLDVYHPNIEGHQQDLIKNIPICGIKEVLFISIKHDYPEDEMIQPIFIYNNSDTNKQIILKDDTGTLIDYKNYITYTLSPHEILYLPMTNYLYLDNILNWCGGDINSITCKLVDDYTNNAGASIREFDNDSNYISNLLTLYNQDSSIHILNTVQKQNQFNDYVSNNRQYGSLGSSKSCNFNEICPIFEISVNNTYEVETYVFFHLMQPDYNQSSVYIIDDTYYIVENIKGVYVDLDIITDEEELIDYSLYEMEFNLVSGKHPNTTGILWGSSNPINIKFREDNPCATVVLRGLYLDVEYHNGQYFEEYKYNTEENFYHNVDTLKYYDFYRKEYSLSPVNYNASDWYKDGTKMNFVKEGDKYKLYICVTVPLNALKVDHNNSYNTEFTIESNLVYLFRGDAPNSSVYDTLGHG